MPWVDKVHAPQRLLPCSRAPSSFALRTSTDKRKDGWVGTPTMLNGVPDRWHLYRVVRTLTEGP